MESKKSYILRDPVHLDIVFPKKYFELINTSEFQRLSRIKQLSCEYLVFPTALHTRFSHGIGTYYVMERLVEQLESILQENGVEVTKEQKELALCSALLHDIGHGPFSHTFEKIFHLGAHEEWTVKIINDKSTEINRSLRANFSKSFIKKLTNIFDRKDIEQEDNIITLISQLISSQMDADRMDYLLRDSYFTSVSNGHYDLMRLIRSLDVLKNNERIQICVNEKYLSSIEEYIMARYYMHKEAYQHPVKRQMEHIITMIFARAKELYYENQELFMESVIKNIFDKKEISVQDYVSMDDYYMYFHIEQWKKHEDYILSTLCRSFLDRKKFKRYRKIEGEPELRDILNEKLRENNLQEIDWSKEYSYIRDTVRFGVYNKENDNIWVKNKDNTLSDISEVSFIFQNMDFSRQFNVTTEYYSEEMIYNKYKIKL